VLEVRELRVGYGGKQVLHGVSLDVHANEVVALVGHNGAGKTTLMRAVMGLVAPHAGTVRFRDVDLPAGAVAATARNGIAFVPQGRHVFRDLSVADNLAIAHDAGLHRLAARGATDGKHGRRVGYDEVHELFPVLRERHRQRAGSLSGGQQQMVALACALLRNPDLIMLDEPSTGLAPVLVEEVFAIVGRLRERFGVGVLVIDQNVRRLLDFANRVYVLKAGEVIHSGPASEIGAPDRLWKLF
jgi:branched-chain amino acid transport system ATP-binding protein